MPTTKKKTTKKVKKTNQLSIEELTPRVRGGGSKHFFTVGKRKTSVARVLMSKGEGKITVNGKPLNEYFALKTLASVIKSPLKLTATDQKFDISVKVLGGGINSQAEAIRHGISKALTLSDPFNKPTLKKAGLLTRDSRIKERKKYGLKRARKAPQFSKR